eukprot:jgi/Tetstr1/423935/TSEL_001417.t1
MGYKSKKRQSKKAAAPTSGNAGGDGGGGAGASGIGMRPSSQASAATTRVSTQLQNLEQKAVEELRSQFAAEERARVEADILRRKRDKMVARLKAKIRLRFESNGSEAESAGSEGSGSDEEGGSQKPGRERPAGLSYKLRETTTRATVRKFIGRKAKQLKAWLTHAVGDDDCWHSVYAESGPGAQFGAPSGGDGGAEQQQQHGDVDAHGADGEEAGIVEEADLVGQQADLRAAHPPPRFILGAVLANYPELLASILESKQFKHHLKAAERRTLLAIRKLWEHNAVHVYTDLKLSQDAFRRLINLSSSKWNADMEKVVQMVLPYGNLMIKWPSVEDMLKGQGEELAPVGLSTTEDMISSTLDLKLVLQHRVRLLLKEGLIKSGESLRIQIVYDDTSVVCVRGKENFLVNSLQNNLPCAFFRRDDCYDDIKRSCPSIHVVMQELQHSGLMVDGTNNSVQGCMGGDLKLLSNWRGLCGCSSLIPCFYCKVKKGVLHRTKASALFYIADIMQSDM